MMNKVENQVKNKGQGNLLKEGVQVPTDDSELTRKPKPGGLSLGFSIRFVSEKHCVRGWAAEG